MTPQKNRAILITHCRAIYPHPRHSCAYCLSPTPYPTSIDPPSDTMYGNSGIGAIRALPTIGLGCFYLKALPQPGNLHQGLVRLVVNLALAREMRSGHLPIPQLPYLAPVFNLTMHVVQLYSLTLKCCCYNVG